MFKKKIIKGLSLERNFYEFSWHDAFYPLAFCFVFTFPY